MTNTPCTHVGTIEIHDFVYIFPMAATTINEWYVSLWWKNQCSISTLCGQLEL